MVVYRESYSLHLLWRLVFLLVETESLRHAMACLQEAITGLLRSQQRGVRGDLSQFNWFLRFRSVLLDYVQFLYHRTSGWLRCGVSALGQDCVHFGLQISFFLLCCRLSGWLAGNFRIWIYHFLS